MQKFLTKVILAKLMQGQYNHTEEQKRNFMYNYVIGCY